MPRIPSREEPYHSVAKCNRHWKTKREFVTKAANKASHVDGSHYLLVCVTPKGNIEVHASEHFYDDTNQTRIDGVINWDVLRRRATSIQAKNEERWTEIERQEKRFGTEGEAEDEDEDADEDGSNHNSSVVGRHASVHDFDASLTDIVGLDGMSQGRQTPTTGQIVFSAAKPSPQRPIAAVTVTPASLEQEYSARFEHLGQSVCANVLKAWIKVVEPKKQTKFPYKDKKGNEGRPPPWWPVGMRHIEPDHLHKDERPRLLASIIQQASRARAEGSAAIAAATAPDLRELTISRLHFATAEIASSIPPRQHYELRQIYLIAKEVRKANEDRIRERRAQGIKTEDPSVHLWSELTVEFFERQPSAIGGGATKRTYDVAMMSTEFDPSRLIHDNKENVDFERSMKRGKHLVSPLADMHHQQALTPLTSHQNVYAVHPFEPHTPHTPHYGWNVAPIQVPQPNSATAPASAPSATQMSQAQQQQQQQQQQQGQQAYYRPMVADMPYSYPASNASYTPPQSQQTLQPSQQTQASQPAHAASQTPAYGSSTAHSYQYPMGYSSGSTPQASQTTPYGTGNTPPHYAAASYGPYEQQTFVSDLAGLSA